MRRAVVDLTSTRPIWAIPARSFSMIADAFGTEWQVRQVTVPTSSDGDGSGEASDVLEAVAGAEVYLGWGASEAVVRAATPTLKWVHTAAAGVGASITEALRSSGAVLTNSRGVHAEPIADWTLAAIAFCARGFHLAAAGRAGRRWAKDEFTTLEAPVRELADLRIGLVGVGGIGSAIARRCAALGMVVRAVRRRPTQRVPKGVAWVGDPSQLVSMAGDSDVLVIAAPHTGETRHLVGDEVLRALPRGAFVVNVSRGTLLDESALLAHLEDGHLGGCVLDVFATEPLPREHAFWSHPKVFVTPHVSGVSHRYWERETTLIIDNTKRYLHGRRLQNIVDLEAGY